MLSSTSVLLDEEGKKAKAQKRDVLRLPLDLLLKFLSESLRLNVNGARLTQSLKEADHSHKLLQEGRKTPSLLKQDDFPKSESAKV
jgi:hypothetical protein